MFGVAHRKAPAYADEKLKSYHNHTTSRPSKRPMSDYLEESRSLAISPAHEIWIAVMRIFAYTMFHYLSLVSKINIIHIQGFVVLLERLELACQYPRIRYTHLSLMVGFRQMKNIISRINEYYLRPYKDSHDRRTKWPLLFHSEIYETNVLEGCGSIYLTWKSSVL